MLRLNKLTDYGVSIMCDLAGQPFVAKSAQELAEKLQITTPTASKILKSLLKSGLLYSVRGARGGYLLSRHPELITLAQVIDALEGPIALTECGLEDGLCKQASLCAVKSNWLEINQQVYQMFEGVSLLAMLKSRSKMVSLTGSRKM